MSTYTDASLIVTPNAYKAGKLYSIKPTSGVGDLDVVRATSATRVNEQGLIEIPRTNLVLRSEELNVSPWTNIAVSTNASASLSPSGSGSFKIIPNTTNTNHYIQQSISVVSGTTYTISFFAKADGYNFTSTFISALGISTFWNLQNGTAGTGGSIINYGNGWYRCIATGVATVTGLAQFRIYAQNSSISSFAGNGIDGILAWGAQLEVGNVATEYIPTTSVIRTKFAGITQDGGSASNIPRLDYTNGSCPSILVEPQRTNLALNSQSFIPAWSTSAQTNATITSTNTIDPEGLTNAVRITNVSGTTMGRVFTVVSGTTYTSSIWVRRVNGVGNVEFVDLNGASAILNLTTEWKRFSITCTAVSIGRFYIRVNTIGDSIEVWGAQLEAGSNATSYIPTVASAVTRNADVISKSGISSLIGQTEGTIFVELNLKNLLGNQNRRIISLSNNNSSSENIQITFTSALTNTIRAVIASGGNFPLITSSQITSLGKIKIALAYSNTDAVLYINGIKQGIDLGATTKPTMNFISLGNVNNSDFLNDNINSAIIFPTRLSNTELAQLTTL